MAKETNLLLVVQTTTEKSPIFIICFSIIYTFIR